MVDPQTKPRLWNLIQSRAIDAIDDFCQLWQQAQAIPRIVYAWPAHPVFDDEGRRINDLVSAEIPAHMSAIEAAGKLAMRTSAYALMLIEQRGQQLVILLESRDGAMAWYMPIERHGDVLVVKKTAAAEDVEGIGILWRRVVGQA